jgi:hypothetical protein
VCTALIMGERFYDGGTLAIRRTGEHSSADARGGGAARKRTVPYARIQIFAQTFSARDDLASRVAYYRALVSPRTSARRRLREVRRNIFERCASSPPGTRERTCVDLPAPKGGSTGCSVG